MNAASIIETFGRGIPVTLDTAMIVDVCAYLRSTQSPAVLVLTSRGELRGVLSHRDIIHASGRLGSSVMQMMAQELMREQVAVCQSGDGLIELLELVTETGSDFAVVADGSQIKGIVTVQDLTELLVTALGGGDAESEPAAATVLPEQPVAQVAEQVMPQQVQHEQQPLLQAQAMPELPVFEVQPQAVPEQWQPQPQPQVAAMPQQQGQWPPAYPSMPDVPPAAAFAQPGQPAPLPVHHAEGPGMHQPQPMPQLQPQHAAFATQPQPSQPQPAAAPGAWATFNS